LDPVTHTLCGVALGNAFFRRRAGPAAVPILALASNLPDIDVVVHVTGDPTAVMMRRMVGHSVFLLPVWSAALAWLLGRRYRHLRFPALFGMVLLGAVVHVFFDLINSFGVVLLWPFSRARPELAWVFIIDFILTGLLALPLVPGLIGRVRLLLARTGLRRSSDRPGLDRLVPLSRASLAGVALYLAFCAGSHARAEGLLERQARGQPEAHRLAPPDFTYVFPEPLGPHRWRGVARTGDTYRLYLVRPLAGRADLREEFRTDLGSPVVDAARRTPLGRRLEWFFKAPVWTAAGPDKATVYDLRFRPLDLHRPAVFSFTVPVPASALDPGPPLP